MALNKPVLDARTYAEIRDDLVQRIPVYAPEWTDHNPSDPGIALLELFAYLAESTLFRFNQIPDATQMEMLRLLQIPLHRAAPSRAMVAFSTKATAGVLVEKSSAVSAGEIDFSTQDEVRVLPIEAVAVAKAVAELPEPDSEEALFYEQAAQALGVTDETDTQPYRVETVWLDEPGVPRDFDATADGVLWVAVLAEKPAMVDAIRQALGDNPAAPLTLNIGFVPDIEIAPVTDTTSPAFADRFRCPGLDAQAAGDAVEWQISTGRIEGDNVPVYRPLRTVGDSSNGLTRSGVTRLELPGDIADMGPFALENPNLAGTGDLPPELDDAVADRLLFWLRGFRPDGRRFGRVLYVGANSARVEQTVRARAESLGIGNGQPGQTFSLTHGQVVPDSVSLEVEEQDGWHAWTEVDDHFAYGESDRIYLVDHEAGQIRFGTGLAGAVPQIGQRIRVRGYLYGGGLAGNVAAGAISKTSAAASVKLKNPLPARGGADAENLAAGLQRIPGELRRRDRAVTAGDFQDLAMQTPGARIGRAEVLPLYHPQLPDRKSAGVVSVIVWPQEDARRPNAPLPDAEQIRAVCAWLDARRLITTELFVMPPKYRPVAVAAGIRVKPGYGIDAVRHWVELVLRQFLAPLPPYGPGGQGWPLGRRLLDAELLAAASQVEGVEYLEGLKLAGWDDAGNRIDGEVPLAKNEVPELIGITVESGPVTRDPGEHLAPAPADRPPVPIPVLKETC